MNVLIIGAMYEPDLGPSAPLYTMLSKGLVQRGHQVTVIATVPHFPSGQVTTAYRGRWIWRSFESGVEVIRIGLPSVDRAHLAQRLLQLICYQLGATIVGIGQKYDAVLSGNPALAVWLPFAWLVVLRHKPAIFSVNDLYPDVGIKLGIFKHRSVISAVTSLECFCLSHATVVQMISDSFRPGLRALGVPDSKMALVQLWVDTDLIRPLNQNNSFSREHNLVDKFVVLYAGNIGRSQGLEHVLTVAEQMLNDKDIQFVFVGDGSAREYLMDRAKRRQLINVQFLPYQPRERLAEVLSCADISLVTLRKGIGSGSLPSKLYSIFASGRPVLASVDEDCETWNLVSNAEAGLCVSPENPSEMLEAIMNLKNDPGLREQLGHNGRIWAEQHHSRQHAAEEFEKLLFQAISSFESTQ